MPKRRAWCGPDAEVPDVVLLKSLLTLRWVQPVVNRSVLGGELQPQTRTSEAEEEHLSAVEAPAAPTGRARHRCVLPKRSLR
jgi:hypothetical protein